jgi:acyl-coenzyme A synthetase/AMP-(fatty) acid ligase
MPEAVAVVWEGGDGNVRRVTYRELRELTDRLAHGLRSLGVGERDTVGIFMPMAIETVAAVMALIERLALLRSCRSSAPIIRCRNWSSCGRSSGSVGGGSLAADALAQK